MTSCFEMVSKTPHPREGELHPKRGELFRQGHAAEISFFARIALIFPWIQSYKLPD